MIKLFTIGSNGKTCKQFFELLKKNKIDLLIDVRLNNKSQLSGFAKGGDEYLGYLLKKICNIKYIHDPYLAPNSQILDKYHLDMKWDEYELEFDKLMRHRNVKQYFKKNYSNYTSICFLCVEEKPDKCHRRLVAECLDDKSKIKHL